MTQFEERIIIDCLNLSSCLKLSIEEISKDKEDIVYFENLLHNVKKLYFNSTSSKRIKNKYHFDLLLNIIEASERRLYEYYMSKYK